MPPCRVKLASWLVEKLTSGDVGIQPNRLMGECVYSVTGHMSAGDLMTLCNV
jgi:hypothetical protein